MNGIKKIVAIIICIAVIFSFTACVNEDEVSVVMTLDEYTVTPGVYVGYLVESYVEAYNLVDPSQKVMKQTIGDVLAEEWIKQTAIDDSESYLASLKKFDEVGLEFTDDDENDAQLIAEYVWSYYGALYEENGCSFDSLLEMSRSVIRNNKLFNYYYAKDGIEEVAESEIVGALNDDYAAVFAISLTLYNADGSGIVDDEEKEVRIEMMNDLINRLNSEDIEFKDVVEEITIWDTGEFIEDDYDAEDYKEVINSNATNYSDLTMAEIFETEIGEASLVEESTNLTLILRRDVNEDTETLEAVRDEILASLKGESYTLLIESLIAQSDLVVNETATSYYSTGKIKEISEF